MMLKPAIAFSSMLGTARRTCMHVRLYGERHVYALVNATTQPYEMHDEEATARAGRLLFNLLNVRNLDDHGAHVELLEAMHRALRDAFDIHHVAGATLTEELAATVLVSIVEPHRARIAWAGDAQAYWLRDADFHDCTIPHIFSQGDANLRRVAPSLGTDDVHIDSRDWALAPGDRIVLTRGVEFHQDAELTLSRMLGEERQEVALELIHAVPNQSPRWIGVLVHDVA